MYINLHWLDIAVLASYVATLLGIGIFFMKRQSKLEDFFLARHGVSWLPVGLSLMAALNSGIDYLMQPSAVIKFGVVVLFCNVSWFFLYPYVFFVTLPLYRRLNVYSVYEYLELRFNLAVRGLGASIFMLWRLGWMATALYVPCLAISSAIGREDLMTPMIIILGGLVTTYTMLGGIEAVIWTDVTQFCIMFTGLAATLIIAVCSVPGGLSEIVACTREVGTAETAITASPGTLGQISYFFALPVTAVGLVIAAVVGRLATYTSDQVMVQRFQTTRTIGDARRGFLITVISDTIWMVALAVLGVALFAYFRHHPLPEIIAQNSDRIFPYFMAQVFPVGLTGLVIAAILAASLSSIDSAINSMTSVLMIDFYNRIYKRFTRDTELNEKQQHRQVVVSRVATIVVGAVGICISCNVAKLGTIFEIANKLINSFTGPILGIFLLGMLTRRANGAGVFVGGLVGTAVTLYTVHLSNQDIVSFLWPSTFGLVATLSVGYFASLILAGVSETRSQWTYWNIISHHEMKKEVIQDDKI